MSIHGEQISLRIYLHSADRAPHTPSYERLIQAARKSGLAGATVLRGILGAGSHGILRPSAWSLTERVPVIVEIVDTASRISGFINDELPNHILNALATLEPVHVLLHRDSANPSPAPLAIPSPLLPLSTLPSVSPRPNMTLNPQGALLRIFIGESDRFNNQPLHEVIVQKARELGLAGATVLRGSEGFGANSVVHKSKLLEMSSDLPIVIEIADAQEKINLLLPDLEKSVADGMITLEPLTILSYRHSAVKSG